MSFAFVLIRATPARTWEVLREVRAATRAEATRLLRPTEAQLVVSKLELPHLRPPPSPDGTAVRGGARASGRRGAEPRHRGRRE